MRDLLIQVGIPTLVASAALVVAVASDSWMATGVMWGLIGFAFHNLFKLERQKP